MARVKYRCFGRVSSVTYGWMAQAEAPELSSAVDVHFMHSDVTVS